LPDWRVVVTGAAIGAPAAAVLLVNNVRDLEPDLRVGRRTLASRLGPDTARWIYALLMLAPFPMLGIALGWRAIGAAWAALPLCLWLAASYFRTPAGGAMNAQLGRTALAQVLLGALLVVELVR
jgi:1,4-dihydroxy-2-naphthoate octaprenyltransferase